MIKVKEIGLPSQEIGNKGRIVNRNAGRLNFKGRKVKRKDGRNRDGGRRTLVTEGARK